MNALRCTIMSWERLKHIFTGTVEDLQLYIHAVPEISKSTQARFH